MYSLCLAAGFFFGGESEEEFSEADAQSRLVWSINEEFMPSPFIQRPVYFTPDTEHSINP